MDLPPNERHCVRRDDKGMKALDILRLQFPQTKSVELREYLRKYKSKGLALPTAKLPGTGKACNREYEQPVVTSRTELDSLLSFLKDK